MKWPAPIDEPHIAFGWLRLMLSFHLFNPLISVNLRFRLGGRGEKGQTRIFISDRLGHDHRLGHSNLQESQLAKVDSPVGRNKAATPAVSGNALGAGNAPLNAPLIPAYSYYGRNDDHRQKVRTAFPYLALAKREAFFSRLEIYSSLTTVG
jgi:hypothetical protein